MMRPKVIRYLARLLRAEQGGTIAEMAIMVPFLILLLAAVSEIGRLFQNYTTLTKATRSASRYLSNHQLNNTELGRAKDLVVCGKLACGVGDLPLVHGLSASNVCIESIGSPKVTSVTVRIPREAGNCGNGTTGTAIGNTGGATPFIYRPVFNIGNLLGVSGFTMALPLAPRTTMYYMID